MDLEMLTQPIEDYMGWMADAANIPAKERRKHQIIEQMQKLRDESVDMLEQQTERAYFNTGI